jgi:prepilin-type N-terminal cleavage/methylation domain-containing protein
MRNARTSAGFTLIELMIVIAIISIIAAIAIPSMLHARKAGNEASALAALKTIGTTEALFRERDAEADGNIDYGMLSELTNTKLLDPVLGTGTKQGYYFQASYSFLSSEYLWFAVANPAIAQSSGDRYFASNAAGQIYYTTGASLKMDTDSCLLPNNGLILTGK